MTNQNEGWVSVGDKIILTDDIYDDGQDHHPPGYIAHKGEEVIVRGNENQPTFLNVSHENITDSSFIVYPHEYDLPPPPKEDPSDE